MTTVETLGVAGMIIAILVGMIQALVAYVFTSKTGAIEKSVATLQEQNREQAIQIASLAQAQSLDRVVQAIEKIMISQQDTSRLLDRLALVVERLDRKTGSSGGEYPVTRPRSGG